MDPKHWFTVPWWVAEIKHVWKRKWPGYSFAGAFLAVFGWYCWHLPPSGYAVVFMAVGAAIMAIRPEMEGWERSLWFLVVVCFAIIEIRAINNDRKQAESDLRRITDGLKTTIEEGKTATSGLQTTINEGRLHFDKTMQRSDAIVNGVADSIKEQTGGDSFAFITFTAEPAQTLSMHWNDFPAPVGLPYFVVSVTSHGRYPLNGTHAILMDDERRLAAMQEFNKHPRGDWIQAIDSADTEYRIPYLRPQSPEAPGGQVDIIGLYSMPSADSKRLSIAFSAPNGSWDEALHLGRLNDIWHQCLSVIGPTVKQASHPFVYCDSDWPEGKALAEKDWVPTQAAKKAQ